MKLRKVNAEKAWPTRTASGRVASIHQGAAGRPLCGVHGATRVEPLQLGGLPRGRRSCRLCRRILRAIMHGHRARRKPQRGAAQMVMLRRRRYGESGL